MASDGLRLARSIVLCASLAATGCSILGAGPTTHGSSATIGGSGSATAPEEARAQNDVSTASSALLAQSRTERAAGQYAVASASAERALRIDPNNPSVWLELGEIELAMGDAAQAATMARKALTLAGSGSVVEARAERLLRDAAQ